MDKHQNLPFITVVFKVDRHCDGCATKIIKCLRNFHGVQWVKADWELSKISIFGTVDPVKLHDKLVKTTMKEVTLVSPLPMKEKSQPPPPKSAQPKEPPVTTVILKMKIHCDGCFMKIQKVIRKFKGVYTCSIDKDTELLTVKGIMDVPALQAKLLKKLKRAAAIVPPKKEKEKEKEKEKVEKDNTNTNTGGQKKNINSGEKADQKLELPDYGAYGMGYMLLGAGYFVETVHAPQIFSDENPNACRIM